MKDLIKKLTETYGPSGCEEHIREVIMGEIEGLADEVLSEMDALETTIGDEGSIWEYYQMALIRSNTFRELEQHDRMAKDIRSYVDWVAALSEDDPRLHRPSLSLNGSDVERERVGPYARFHTWCFMLGTLAQARHKAEEDVAPVFEELDGVLQAHEARVGGLMGEEAGEDAVKEASSGLARGYTRAGEAAAITGDHERALRYFEREEELAGRLDMHGPVYRAASLCAVGRTAEAKERLAAISGRLVASGQWRTMFGQLDAFDPIRKDPEVIAVIDEWQRTEESGKGA